MQSTSGDSKIEINTNTSRQISSVFFTEDGKEVFSREGSDDGMLKQWKVADGKQVGQIIGGWEGRVNAATLSPDGKWLVCALGPSKHSANDRRGSLCVWENCTNKKILDVKDYYGDISSIEISPDSTKFATAGGNNKLPFIWSLATGAKVVGPLQPDDWVVAVRFSPSGDHIAATARRENTDQWYSNSQDRLIYSIFIYNSNNGQQLMDIPFSVQLWTPLAWSPDGRQLLATLGYQVKRFNSTSGTLLNEYSIGGGHAPTSVVLSRNEKFFIVSSGNSLRFCDSSSQKSIATAISSLSNISCVAISPSGDCIATGEYNGRITLRNLHGVLPRIYFTLNLPYVCITDAVFKSWTNGDLSRAEELLSGELVHSSDSFYHAYTLANRALVRARLGQHHIALNDAKESIEIKRSVIGHIANAMASVSNGEHDLALRAFDLVFSDGLAAEHNLLLLIKAIILFKFGKRDDAISRVDDLISIVDDRSLYATVRAQMFLIRGGVSLRERDNERAIEWLKQAREALPFQKSPSLVTISLIFGWDFDKLAHEIQSHFQECIKPIEADGDAVMHSGNPGEAIVQYSLALTLDPLNPSGLLVKRSKAHGMLASWEEALEDAHEAIKADPLNPWGYQRRHAALHALQQYNEAVEAFSRMCSLIEESLDQETRQLGAIYILPSRLETTIENIVRGVSKACPPVLIDVKSGRLCDETERMNTFKSESQFKELVSSMIEELDEDRILQVVGKYFQYVMFSDVWDEKETSFQDVNLAVSVWKLDSSLLNEKLKRFCEAVRVDDLRWAWSDTCVDKTINTVLNHSLTTMYRWYETSVTTLVLLADVASPSSLGDLSKSAWMKQSGTLQVALAPKVVRFYNNDWKPYLGDTRDNHKESPEIVQELADAIGVAQETIIAFDADDLSVREKLRLASTRNATVEEDVAYSLIGIFKSDIQPRYGEGYAAMGHLLEEILARSGDVTVLSWGGKPSAYNSCLPLTLAVYSQPPRTFTAIEDTEMDERVTATRNSVARKDVMLIYDRTIRLPPPRFANRRLHLPCIIFAVKKLNVQDSGGDGENRYRARVSGIGQVEFQTPDSLFTEPFKLIFVHPWIRDLRDPFDTFTWESDEEADEDGSGSETDFESAPSSPLRAAASPMDDYTRALRLVTRLQQPFYALLLQQQRNGQFKRVATEHEIELPGIDYSINFARDVRTEVVEIL